MTNNSSLQEAEMSVIGAVLLDDKHTLPLIADSLKHTHFYNKWLGGVYSVMLKMAYDNIPIDFITLTNRLLQAEYNEGDIKQQLTLCMEICPTIHHIKEHACIVFECFKSRSLTQIAQEIIAGGEDNSDINELISTACEKMAGLAFDKEGEKLSDLGDIIVGKINHMFDKNRLKSRIDLGIANVDRILDGINKSDLIVLGARPAVGKSAFIMQIAKNAALKGKRVAFYTLEMGSEQVMQRYLSNTSSVSLKAIKNIECSQSEINSVMKSCDVLYKLPLMINDRASISVADIKNECRFIKNLDLIIIDYLQLIKPDTSQRYNNRTEAVGEISRNLKVLAKELNVPVIALSQLNRTTDETKEPSLADLRESGSIEQDADVVMLLWKFDEENNIVGCKICKNRHGEVGKAALSFDGAHMRFLQANVDLSEKKKKRFEWEED